MALKIHYEWRQAGVTLQSGHCYVFNYSAYENDPEPVVLYLNSISGTHPKTGRQWRFHQAINLNYLPRFTRQQFVSTWMTNLLQSKGNVKLTWERTKTLYPYVKEYIRRYFYSPAYYIRNLRYIPPDKANDEIVRSMFKDYSIYAKRRFAAHFRRDQMKGKPRR